MIRLLAFAVERFSRGCTCDPRFVDVAHDIDCPVHGLPALALGRLQR